MVMQSIQVDGVIEDVLNNAVKLGFAETKSEFIRTAIVRYAIDLKILNESISFKTKGEATETVEAPTLNLIDKKDGLSPEVSDEIEIDIDKFSELSEETLQADICDRCLDFLKSNNDRIWSPAGIAEKLGVGWRQVVSPLSKLTRDKIIERKYKGLTPYYLFRGKITDKNEKQTT